MDMNRPPEGTAQGVHIPAEGGSVSSAIQGLGLEKNHTESAQGFNQATWTFHLPREVNRLGHNWEVLSRRHKSGIAEGVEKAPRAAPGTPVICIGSGPSADRCIPLLKDWNGGIICTTSQGQTLRRYGVEPDYMIALDSDSNSGELGPYELWRDTKTALITQPGVTGDLIDYWKKKMYLFRKFEPIADEPRIVYNFVMPLMFSDTKMTDIAAAGDRRQNWETWIPVQFVMLANAAPHLVFTSKLLGYSTIFLSGVEFGWKDDSHSRFTEWRYEQNAKKKRVWKAYPPPITNMANQNIPQMIADNGNQTTSLQLFYKRNFLLACRLDKMRIWDAGGEGALDEIPKCAIEEVIATQGACCPEYDIEAVVDRYDRYLAGHDTYVVEYNSGYMFVESSDPFTEFPVAFARFRRQGIKDADIVKNLVRIAKAKDIPVTEEMKAEWEDRTARMSHAPTSQEAILKMDKMIGDAKKAVAELAAMPSLGVVSGAIAKVEEIKKALAG